jgi:hypothetical protein
MIFQSGYSQANTRAKTAAPCRDGGMDFKLFGWMKRGVIHYDVVPLGTASTLTNFVLNHSTNEALVVFPE